MLTTPEVSRSGGTNVLGGRVWVVGARVGFGLFRPDAGGVLRRMDWGSSSRVQGRTIPRSRVAAPTTIAYVGPSGTVPTYSYADVLHGRVPAAAFKGKAVVVGAMAKSLGDLHATPYGAGNPMGCAEIVANAVETALHDFPLRASRTRALLLIALFAFLVPLASMFLRWRSCVLIAALAAGLYLAAAQLSFDHGVLLAVTWPLIALALGTCAAAALRPPRRPLRSS